MSLEGTWYNELGSVMIIDQVVDGSFQLTYETAVSTKHCAKGTFNGSGYLNTSPLGQTIAFSISWLNDVSNCASVTAWSGQLQDDDGEGSIMAFWLLTGINPKTEWAPTNIGQDVFTKKPPTEDMVTQQLKLKVHSHP